MTNGRTHIVLIEIGNSHEECLLTQVIALESKGVETTLICNQEIEQRSPFFKDYFDHIYCIDTKTQSKKQISKLVWKKIKEVGATKVVFNTAQGTVVRNVCLKALLSKIEFIGVIHTTRKFKGSITQKVINLKIKKYFLLSEYLFNTIEESLKKAKLHGTYFYPIHFPTVVIEPQQKEIIEIGIIGGVETRRKDLVGFFDLVKSSSPSIHFRFIGKSNLGLSEVQDFIAKIGEEEIEERVFYSSEFLSQERFDAEVQRMKFILPLVHPNTPSADQYFTNQISGAVNVAFAYQIPLLIHEAYKHVSELKETSFFYDLNNFSKVIEQGIEQHVDVKMRIAELFDKTLQEERYTNFVLA